ncbi:T9SS type A sorting domain-containing protein [Algibacter sp. AS12]|uniref:T9SS type A sorting domain-containing protein n=1 Tax=Algibacter sp. AS12 TaxID=3135773 RepID=UPI00398AE547
MKKQLLLNLTFLLFTIGVFAQSSGSFSGTVTVSDNEDNYQIISSGNGTYMITLTSDQGTAVSLMPQPDNYSIAGINNLSGVSPQSTVSSCVENNQNINVLVFKTNSSAIFSNSYTIDYQFIPLTYSVDSEPNDNYSQSITTQENINYEGWFNNDNKTTNVDSVDWYKFTSPRNGELSIIINDGDEDDFGNLGLLELYDNSLNLIDATTVVVSGLTKTYKFSNFNFSGNDFGIRLQGNCVSYQFSWTVDDSTLSVDNYNLNSSIKLYPNPVSNNLSVKISNNLNIEKVEIIGITGKLIKETNFINNSISTQNLKNGIYFVKIYTDKGISTKKIIKSE